MAPVLGEALGSIPARAGEPCGRRPGAGSTRVYPRTCGGTVEAAVQPERGQGLSPHVRGNLQAVVEHPRVRGSIPARAGEPRTLRWRTRESRVYPRTCGGTSQSLRDCVPPAGLSPHVRGNPGREAGVRHRAGSIPARAGEPGVMDPGPTFKWVYPRTCGGTVDVHKGKRGTQGLSPHVRGNLRAASRRRRANGSIPARAGEPRST